MAAHKFPETIYVRRDVDENEVYYTTDENFENLDDNDSPRIATYTLDRVSKLKVERSLE